MRTPHISSGGRFPVLRALGILCVILAAVGFVAGLVLAAWALFRGPLSGAEHLVIALIALAGAFFLIVSSLAIAEVVKLFLDIEHNTRVIALISMGQKPADIPSMGGNGLRGLDDQTAEAALLSGN